MSCGKRYNTPDDGSSDFQYLFGVPLYVDKNAKYKSLEPIVSQPSGASCKDKKKSISNDINIKNTCSDRTTSKSSKSEKIKKIKDGNKKLEKDADLQFLINAQDATDFKRDAMPKFKQSQQINKIKHENMTEVVKTKKEKKKELNASNANQVSSNKFYSTSPISPIKLQLKSAGKTDCQKTVTSLCAAPTESTTSMNSTFTKSKTSRKKKSPKQIVSNSEVKEKTKKQAKTKKDQQLNRSHDVQKIKSQNMFGLETNTAMNNSFNSSACVSTHQAQNNFSLNTIGTKNYTTSIFDPPDPSHNPQNPQNISSFSINTAEMNKYTPSIFDPPVSTFNDQNSFSQNISNLSANTSEINKYIPSVFDPSVNTHDVQSALVHNASSLSINSAKPVLNNASINMDHCYKRQQTPHMTVKSSNTKLALQSAYNNKRRIETQQRNLEPIEKVKKIEKKVENVARTLNIEKSQSTSLNKKSTVNNVKNFQDYWIILKGLNNHISKLSAAKLQKVADLIASTGLYEITTDTFDFDLCQLDLRTVRELQLYFANEKNV